MRKMLACLLSMGLLSFAVAAFTGCGGTESGTKQISEKAGPDPELNPVTKPHDTKRTKGAR